METPEYSSVQEGPRLSIKEGVFSIVFPKGYDFDNIDKFRNHIEGAYTFTQRFKDRLNCSAPHG